MSFTIGSLFDGSGGFPLAAFMRGGVPVWASEIEPYPIAVTKSRFPHMKHLGSVTDIKGNEVDPVDVITFGSPCQDLSVAGKRAGLKHEDNGDEETTRSGLFMDAVRIIKEMREATNGEYPKYAVWENVPGAFSSNKGEDFRIVLEELIKTVEPTAVMPDVPKTGWSYSDYYCGGEWSIAYRVLDAQYWGVPQRRRRIYLVLDLTGERAGEILFKRESLRGYFETGRTPWKEVTGDVEGGSGAADSETECVTLEPGIAAREGGHIYEDVSGTLRANAGDNQMSVAYSFDSLSSNSMKSSNPNSGCRQVEVSKCLDTTDPNPCKNQGGIAVLEPCTLKIRSGCEGGGKGALIQENMSATLATNNDQYLFQPVSDEIGLIDTIGGQAERAWMGDTCPTLKASHYKFPPTVVFKADDGSTGEVAPTLVGDHNNRVTDHTALIVEPCVCLEGNGTRPSHKGDGYKESDVMYTLNTVDQHGVAYSCETFHCTSEEEKTTTLKARDYKDPTVVAYDPIVLDRAYFNQGQNAQYDPQTYEDGICPTLVARGPSAVCHNTYQDKTGTLMASGYAKLGTQEAMNDMFVANNYIVRRLTPTECARLQGFPDEWGHPDQKDDFTDEEYQFWLNVRNTHAEINGKTVKDYTKAQMLTWYNKLHTDSSEYKLWGNGIALPCALYVLQGIGDVLNHERN